MPGRLSFLSFNRSKEHLQAWSSFLPTLAVEQLSTLAPQDGDGEAEAERDLGGDGMVSTFEAAALFADASGFTALTERLAKQPDGAERMCAAMNGFLTRMIECVHHHGGDVVKFAGDAVSVIFTIEDDGIDSRSAATCRATACALELHKRVEGFVAWTDPADGTAYTLSLHIGVGVGLVTMMHLGGHQARCELVFAGAPMNQSAEAEPQAASGETCLSPEAWQLVSEHAVGTPITQEATTDQAAFVLVSSFNPPGGVPLRSLGGAPMANLRGPMLPYLQRYVPLAAAMKLHAMTDSSATSGLELSEMRHVSVMFVALQGLRLASDAHAAGGAEALAHGQAAMLAVQEEIQGQEGQVNKMLVDDKGTVLLCVFGLPPRPHADDALRAVRAALALKGAMDGADGQPMACVGVASGRAFCGIVGSPERREFTTMGDVVNLSARLMGLASKGGDGPRAVCCESTRLQTLDQVQCRALPPTKLKGKEHMVALFEPLREVESKKRGGTVGKQGRDLEFDELRGMLAQLFTYHNGGTIMLLGKYGSGKKVLVAAAEKFASMARTKVLHGGKEDKKDKKDKKGAEKGSIREGAPKTALRGLHIVASGQRVLPAAHGHGRRSSVVGPAQPLVASVEDAPPVTKEEVPTTNEGVAEASKSLCGLVPGRSLAELHGLANRGSGVFTETNQELTQDEIDYTMLTPAFGAWTSVVGSLISEAAAADNSTETEFVLSALEKDRELANDEAYCEELARRPPSQAVDCLARPDVKQARKKGLASWAWLLNDLLPDGHAPLELSQPLDAEEASGIEGWLIQAMILALFAHYRRGRGRRLMVLLHLLQSSDRDSKVDVWSWRTALAVSHQVRAGYIPQMILVIASRQLSLLHEFRSYWRQKLNQEIERNFQDLVTESEATSSYLMLKPLPAAARERYMLEVLRAKHDYTGDLEGVPRAMSQCMSEYAAGNPYYIEMMLESLFRANAIQIEMQNREGEIVKVIRSGSLKELKAVPPPPKMRAVIMQEFDSFTPPLQRMLKVLAPLTAFSEGMVEALPLPDDVQKRSSALIASAVSEGILEEVKSPPIDVLSADPRARQSWVWLQVLMRDELLSNLLHAEREQIERKMDELRQHNRRGGSVATSNATGKRHTFTYQSVEDEDEDVGGGVAIMRPAVVDELRRELHAERLLREQREKQLRAAGIAYSDSASGPTRGSSLCVIS